MSEHAECPELAPLIFFLVQAGKPQRALEIGTTTGDSYFALCQAVQSCGLATECASIPRRRDSSPDAAWSNSFEEFRSYHDVTYSDFSKITDALADASPNPYIKFDFIHLVSPRSGTELEDLCRESLSQLNPSGVALISGLQRLEAAEIDGLMTIWHGRYSSRILQLHSTVIVLSKRPLGLIRLLLQSSDQEFADAVQLFRLLGDRARSNAAAQHTAHALQQSRARYESLAQKFALLQKKYDCLASREIEAQAQRGNKDLHLNLVWAEREDFRKRLTGEHDSEAAAQSQDEETLRQPRKDVGSRRLIVELYQHYCNAYPTTPLTGKDFWESCGRDILDSVLRNQHRLDFTTSARPAISIIVVLRNKAQLSILGLCSLLRDFRSNYELVIVDNDSSDETPRLLSLIDCTRVIRNDTNLGFGPAVMQALPWLSGELVCLLNNDALVEPGAIETMISLFTKRPATGAAGGKILLAEGRLQEAGCLIWRDGRTRQYGRGDDPQLAPYSFLRPVDYCSGAFLVTPRALFAELGGLDESYGAGYYEDVDYCEKVWQAGRSVIYEPQAILHHYEGGSSANEIAALRLLVPNHRHFTSRWGSALRLHQIDTPENVLRARTASVPGMLRLLYIVDPWGVPALEGELAQRRQESDRFCFTCLYTDSDLLRSSLGQTHKENDVERLSLDTLSRADLEAYFSASDKIVLVAHPFSIAQLDSLLESNAAKLSRVSVEVPTSL